MMAVCGLKVQDNEICLFSKSNDIILNWAMFDEDDYYSE